MFSWCQSHLKYRYFGTPKQQESSKAAMQHSESPIKQLSSQQEVESFHEAQISRITLSFHAVRVGGSAPHINKLRNTQGEYMESI